MRSRAAWPLSFVIAMALGAGVVAVAATHAADPAPGAKDVAGTADPASGAMKVAATAGLVPGAKKVAAAAKPDSSATSRASASRARSVAKAPAVASRRLEPTHIQGDIPVPQVLFVTARDQRRFMSAHHQKYLKTSRALAESTPIPTRMIVTRGETEAGR